jgi:hypothetical protein
MYLPNLIWKYRATVPEFTCWSFAPKNVYVFRLQVSSKDCRKVPTRLFHRGSAFWLMSILSADASKLCGCCLEQEFRSQ